MTAIDYMLEQGRRPSFDARGNVRGFRSRPGAPTVAPPSGLKTGSNAMGASSWANTFRDTGDKIQVQALRERQRAGVTEDEGLFSGITGKVIDSITRPQQSFNGPSPSAAHDDTGGRVADSGLTTGINANSRGAREATWRQTFGPKPFSSTAGLVEGHPWDRQVGGSPSPAARVTAFNSDQNFKTPYGFAMGHNVNSAWGVSPSVTVPGLADKWRRSFMRS